MLVENHEAEGGVGVGVFVVGVVHARMDRPYDFGAPSGDGDAIRGRGADGPGAGWFRHVTAFLVWAPILPVLAASNLHPAGGILSDSLASANGVGLVVVVVWAYSVAAIVEYLVLDRPEGLWTAPLFALVAFTTRGQATLLGDGNECNWYCVLHNALLIWYSLAELAGLWSRGYAVAQLAPYAASIFALVLYYRLLVGDGDGFVASEPDTLQRLRLVGALEIGAFAISRSLIAAV